MMKEKENETMKIGKKKVRKPKKTIPDDELERIALLGKGLELS